MQHVTDRAGLKAKNGQLDRHETTPPTYDPLYFWKAGPGAEHHACPSQAHYVSGRRRCNQRIGPETRRNLLALKSPRHHAVLPWATGADAQGGAVSSRRWRRSAAATAYIAEKARWTCPRLPPQKISRSISKLRICGRARFLAKPIPDDEVISGINWGTEPPLLGYNVSSRQGPARRVALTAPDHRDPVFAYWRYGPWGRDICVSPATDRPHWALHWLPWPGFFPLLGADSALVPCGRIPTQISKARCPTDNGPRPILVVDCVHIKRRLCQRRQDHGKTSSAPDLSLKPVTLSPKLGPGRLRRAALDADQNRTVTSSMFTGGEAAPNGPPRRRRKTVSLVVAVLAGVSARSALICLC